jgi:hypothetical protein
MECVSKYICECYHLLGVSSCILYLVLLCLCLGIFASILSDTYVGYSLYTDS